MYAPQVESALTHLFVVTDKFEDQTQSPRTQSSCSRSNENTIESGVMPLLRRTPSTWLRRSNCRGAGGAVPIRSTPR